MSRYYVDQTINMSGLFESLVEYANWPEKNTPRCGLWKIVYGFDHACGYFVQLNAFDEMAEKIAKKITGGDTTVDLDSLFCGLSGVKLGFFLKKIGEVSNNNQIKIHSESCYLDLPF